MKNALKTRTDARMCLFGVAILLIDIFRIIYPKSTKSEPLWEIPAKTKTINISLSGGEIRRIY
jgi:hypothetical protein